MAQPVSAEGPNLCGRSMRYRPQCKEIPRPFGSATRHTAQAAHAPCTNPVLFTRGEEVAFGELDAVPTPHEGILAVHGGEDVKLARRPHSIPTRHWRRSATPAQTRGRRHNQSLPRSRLHLAISGGVRSMARPVSVPSKGWDRTYPFGRSLLLRFGRPGVCGTTSGGVRTDWRRHALTAPTWRSRTRYSLRDRVGPLDAPRGNLRALARGGCQTRAMGSEGSLYTV